VGAYPWQGRHIDAKPAGTAFETETVDASGTLTFTTLAGGGAYDLYAEVSGANRNVAVSDSGFTPLGTLKERIKARQEAAGV
jgi:histidyl-tRNA synthetase